MLNLPVIPRQKKERVMKNAVGVFGLIGTVAVTGWSFGSGSLDAASVTLAVVGWLAIIYSCIED